MDKDTARNFIPMVNDPQFYPDLKLYAAFRIEALRKELETCELTDVQKNQGKIQELKRIFTLRDEVIQKAN